MRPRLGCRLPGLGYHRARKEAARRGGGAGEAEVGQGRPKRRRSLGDMATAAGQRLVDGVQTTASAVMGRTKTLGVGAGGKGGATVEAPGGPAASEAGEETGAEAGEGAQAAPAGSGGGTPAVGDEAAATVAEVSCS